MRVFHLIINRLTIASLTYQGIIRKIAPLGKTFIVNPNRINDIMSGSRLTSSSKEGQKTEEETGNFDIYIIKFD